MKEEEVKIDMNIQVIGPDPSMSYRNGGVAKFVKYQSELQRYGELEINFNYLDWAKFSHLRLPMIVRKNVGIFAALMRLIFTDVNKTKGVHIHASLYNKGAIKHLLLSLVCKLKGCPSLLQIHGGRLSKLNGISRKIWSLAFYHSVKIALFPGPQYEEFEEHRYKKKLIRIANFIPDTSEYDINKNYKSLSYLFLGRVVEEKGVFLLLESFLRLKQEGLEASLTITGNGDGLKILKKKVYNSGFKENIKVTGYLNGRDLDDIIAKCNVFVLPSWHEGFPLSFLECALHGMVPIITTNNGIPFYFEKNKHYLSIDLKNKDSLYGQLKRVATDASLRERIGERVKKRVKNQFTTATYLPRLIVIYKSAFISGNRLPYK